MKVAVLGAGLSGLSFANRIAENKIAVDVFEKQANVGGIAKTIKYDGFNVDLGPHRFHTKDKKLIDTVGGWISGNWQMLERKSRIYMEGRFFDFPLKASNVILTMPPLTSLQIMLDYVTNAISRRVTTADYVSFEDWVVRRFGKKLYDIYFKPYNEKLWGIPSNKMSADWASQRISLLSLWDTIKKTLVKSADEPRTYVSKFHYPKTGGIGLISENLKARVERMGGKVYLDSKLISVDCEADIVKSVTYETAGKTQTTPYDLVVSSIPVTSLINLIKPSPPADILKTSQNLKFRAIIFVYIIIGDKSISDNHWVYIPDKNMIFNRISEPRNFSKENVPKGKNIVCAEISCDIGDEIWNMEEGQIRQKVVAGLKELGFISEDDVIDFFIHREDHAYPVYDLKYKSNLKVVTDYLSRFDNMISIGRNGLFRYDNMDHSIKMGLLAADSIMESDFKNAQDVVEKIAGEEEYFG